MTLETARMDSNRMNPTLTSRSLASDFRGAKARIVPALASLVASVATNQPALPVESNVDLPQQAVERAFSSAIESVIADGLCETSERRQTLINYGVETLVSDDPSFTKERAKDVRLQLNHAEVTLLKACRQILPLALNAADGPFPEIEQSVRRAVEQVSPADLTAASEFMQSSAAPAIFKMQRTIAADAERAFTQWFERAGPTIAKSIVTTALDQLPDEHAAPAASALNGQRTATVPATGPTSTQRAWATAGIPNSTPARLLNKDKLGDACSSFYPTRSRMLAEEGSVILLLRVSEEGVLQGVVVQNSSGYPALDIAAAGCVGAVARFAPMQQDGKPIASWQRMKWNWSLTD